MANNALNFPVATTPVVDPATGMLTREWLFFFSTMYRAIGGPTIAITPDQATQYAISTVRGFADLDSLRRRVSYLEDLLVASRTTNLEPIKIKTDNNEAMIAFLRHPIADQASSVANWL